ncbi:hypothetical protein Aros01_02318 [Streptosporangium roseum]
MTIGDYRVHLSDHYLTSTAPYIPFIYSCTIKRLLLIFMTGGRGDYPRRVRHAAPLMRPGRLRFAGALHGLDLRRESLSVRSQPDGPETPRKPGVPATPKVDVGPLGWSGRLCPLGFTEPKVVHGRPISELYQAVPRTRRRRPARPGERLGTPELVYGANPRVIRRSLSGQRSTPDQGVHGRAGHTPPHLHHHYKNLNEEEEASPIPRSLQLLDRRLLYGERPGPGAMATMEGSGNCGVIP